MPEQPQDKRDSAEFEEKVKALIANSQVRELSPLQTAYTNLTWAVVLSLIVSVGFIAWVWHSKLPPLPPLNGSADEISHYRELTEIANEDVKNLVETVIAKVLLPILTLFTGVLIGRKIGSSKTED
jgi:hypothetical protein